MLPDCADAMRPLWDICSSPTDRIFRGLLGGCGVPHIIFLHEDLAAAGIARQDNRSRWAEFHRLRYSFCTQMGQRSPIQKVKELTRHSTIKLTADLYTDLGMTDVAEECWYLQPLLPEGLPAAVVSAAGHVSAGGGASEQYKELSA
jgi:hypothetical protein